MNSGEVYFKINIIRMLHTTYCVLITEIYYNNISLFKIHIFWLTHKHIYIYILKIYDYQGNKCKYKIVILSENTI